MRIESKHDEPGILCMVTSSSLVKKHGGCRSKKNLERDEEFLRSVGESDKHNYRTYYP